MKKPLLLFTCMLTIQIAFSQQSVGIGTSTPAASAKLDVTSTTQGMLVPRMTTAQRIAISSPASGLLVFDMTTNSFWFRGSSTWVQLVDSVHTEVHRNGPTMIYAGMTDNVGIGILAPANKLDLSDGSLRQGTHATNRPLYVTGDIGPNNNGIEFRHSYGTEGIGFGYNTIYAAGSNVIQDLGIQAKGAFGNLLFSTNDTERMRVTGDGKVGIGNPNPHAPLQFSNDLEYRKIVLHDEYNNDNQYFGFGVNAGQLRYQTNGDHTFYSGVNSTTSKELMRVKYDGRVGIGVNEPTANLEIARGNLATAQTGSLQIDGTNYNSHFNYGTEENTYIRGGKPGANVLINEYGSPGNVGIGTATPLQKLHVGGKMAVDDFVGLGNTDPHAPLQFSQAEQIRKIVLYEHNNNDHEFLGFGASNLALRYQVPTSYFNHIFYSGASASSSNELMRIQGDGNVGIGVSSPSATLEIKRGTAPTGTLQIDGTNYDSHFNYGTEENTYIRGGKPGAKVIINEYGAPGNVGIGTADPSEKLGVNGNVIISGSLKIGYIRVQSLIPVAVSGFANGSASCNCPPGYVILGGGFQLGWSGVDVIKSQPNGDTSWFVYVYNRNGFNVELYAEGICARLAN